MNALLSLSPPTPTSACTWQLLVLKYVQNKDVFMRYHKTHLTRRLILETSADSEKEENMVEWLRDVGMPAEYVNKLARMFQDIKVSEDLNQEFKDANRGAHVAGEEGRERGVWLSWAVHR